MLGRTGTRTGERMYCQTIRTVIDIFRDDRARIANCRLRTPTDRHTDRLKDNYSIDVNGLTAYFHLYDIGKIMCYLSYASADKLVHAFIASKLD